MRQIGRDIDVAFARVQPVEIFGEGFPVPWKTFGHDHAWDILDALHHVDQRVLIGLAAGRKADAAIAHDHRGYAMRRRWCQFLAPDRLSVIMRVHIDKAGGDDATFGVDFFTTGCQILTDRGNTTVADGKIGVDQFAAGAIGNDAAPDDQIIFAHIVARRPPQKSPSFCVSRSTAPRTPSCLRASSNGVCQTSSILAIQNGSDSRPMRMPC